MNGLPAFIAVAVLSLLPIAIATCGCHNHKLECPNKSFPKDMPWLGIIRYGTKDLCTGVVISANVVLAPAHCVLWEDSDNDVYFFRHGGKNKLINRFVHPEYDLNQFDKDIAVLRLQENLTDPLSIVNPSGNYLNAQYLTVFGHPLIIKKNQPRTVIEAQAQTTGRTHCQRKYGYKAGVEATNELCAYIKDERIWMTGTVLMGIHVDSRNGSCSYYPIGLLTRGSMRQNEQMPDLFTLISPYREWINKVSFEKDEA